MKIIERAVGWMRRAPRRVFERPDEPVTAAIVLPLGAASSNWMARAQLELLRRRGSNPAVEATPHVTLKLGFKVADPGAVADWLERLAHDLPALRLTLRGGGLFPEGIVYVDVVVTPEMEQVRQRILRGLSTEFGVKPAPIEGDSFKFHATLAYGLPRPVLEGELRALLATGVEFHETVSSVELWTHVGTHWFPYRRVALSGSAAA